MQHFAEKPGTLEHEGRAFSCGAPFSAGSSSACPTSSKQRRRRPALRDTSTHAADRSYCKNPGAVPQRALPSASCSNRLCFSFLSLKNCVALPKPFRKPVPWTARDPSVSWQRTFPYGPFLHHPSYSKPRWRRPALRETFAPSALPLFNAESPAQSLAGLSLSPAYEVDTTKAWRPSCRPLPFPPHPGRGPAAGPRAPRDH